LSSATAVSDAGPAPDDEEFVAAAREGDETAFETLVLRHRRGVTAVASRFFFGRPEAEDAAQEAFVKAFMNLGKLKPGTPFGYWVLRVATNCCLDRLRREGRRGERPLSQVTENEAVWLDRHLGARSQHESRALERSREARSLVARVLPRIAPKDRAALYLLEGEGRSVEEVAAIFGWSKANVRVRAFRARRALRRAIEELGETQQGRQG
jgi:RNA polymerase sigma-70 factor (ECF subfamily)